MELEPKTNPKVVVKTDVAKSWKTTWLGISKYVLSFLAIVAVATGVDLAVDPDGTVSLPAPGEAWYVYVLLILRWVVGVVQSYAMRDDAVTSEGHRVVEPTPRYDGVD